MPTAQTPENARWWSDFHADQGKDSEEEQAYLGWLSTHNVPALEVTADELSRQYRLFYAWFIASPPPETRQAPPARPRHR